MAQLELKLVRDKLNQHKKQVEMRMEELTQAAKRLLREGNRERAKSAMKKKHLQVADLESPCRCIEKIPCHQSKLIDQADEKILRICELLSGIETAQYNKQVLGLKKARWLSMHMT